MEGIKTVDWKRSKYCISIKEAKSEGDPRNWINIGFSPESQISLAITHQGEKIKWEAEERLCRNISPAI